MRPAVPAPAVCPAETAAPSRRDLCSPSFVTALFLKPGGPLEGWVVKKWSVCSGHCSAVRKEILPSATVWLDLGSSSDETTKKAELIKGTRLEAARGGGQGWTKMVKEVERYKLPGIK